MRKQLLNLPQEFLISQACLRIGKEYQSTDENVYGRICEGYGISIIRDGKIDDAVSGGVVIYFIQLSSRYTTMLNAIAKELDLPYKKYKKYKKYKE